MLLDQKRLLAGNCRTPCDVKLANEKARLSKNPVIFHVNSFNPLSRNIRIHAYVL